MALQPDASKQTRWLHLIRLWLHARPKVSVRDFCFRRGLDEHNFYAWRRTLRQRGLIQDLPPPKATQSSSPLKKPSAFVKLTVAADAEPARIPAPATAIELVLSDQHLLRVRPGFDPDTLRQLVRLLEEPSC